MRNNSLNEANSQANRALLISGMAIWSIAALFYAYEFTQRVSPSVMIPQLMLSFGKSRAELGILSATYFYAYALVQVPAGILVDRYGVRIILTFACLLVALGSFMLNASYTLTFACFSRFLIGAGSAFAFVSCLKIVSVRFKPQAFPLMVGLTNLCGVLGAIAGGQPLAKLMYVLTWRETYMCLGILGMIIAAAIWAIVRDGSHDNAEPKHDSTELMKGIKHVIKSPLAWLLAIYGMLIVAPITGWAELWGVEFFETSYCLKTDAAAGFLKYIFYGIAVGGPTIGWLSGKFPKIKLWLIFGSLLTLTTLSAIIFLNNLSFVQLKSLLFIYGFASSHMLLCFSIANQAFPLWAHGAAMGFVNMMIMGGSAIFQPLIGKLIDLTFEAMETPVYENVTYEQYSNALSVLPICIIVAVILTVFIRPGHK